jgi:hypothetical protein
LGHAINLRDASKPDILSILSSVKMQLLMVGLKWNPRLKTLSLTCTQFAGVKQKFEFTALLVAMVFTNIHTEILMPLNPSQVLTKLINKEVVTSQYMAWCITLPSRKQL